MKWGTSIGASAIILCIFLVAEMHSDPGSYNVSEYSSSQLTGPIPGKFVVAVSQNGKEQDVFSIIDGRIATRLGTAVDIKLRDYQLSHVYKGFHRDGKALYSLTFLQESKTNEIIEFLESLPGVVCAQQDYNVTFLAEPNDLYYQSDSAAPLAHWVPDSMNCLLGTRGLGRTCSPMFTCCPAEEVQYLSWTYRDSLHMSDQWYLQRTQANRAWDITKGSNDVKIMVMDSGIDIGHPDLAANIWDNSAVDPPGDANEDGLPGTGGDDDGDHERNYNDWEIAGVDFNGNNIGLWGLDYHCDAGADGDYGFGPDAIDNYPPGPGGGDDAVDDPQGDPWDDNLRGPGSLNPLLSFDDDFEDVQFAKRDDDENGYIDDFCGVNFYDPLSDWHRENELPDGLPGIKDEDVDGDGFANYNDMEVCHVDFDGDGVSLCGPDGIPDCGLDGDYGFGVNGRDDYPEGPSGGDDVPGAWNDNRKGYGKTEPFDDDLDDVQFMRFDNEEDGNPLSPPVDDSCPKSAACHGTGMAGIIGAVTDNSIGMAGVAWNCKLVPAKIAIGYPESAGSGSVIPIVEAIAYAMHNGIDVINMSFGDRDNTYNQPIIDAAIANAYGHGIIMIAGAGNRYGEYYYYPGSHPMVICASGCNRLESEAKGTTYSDSVDVCGLVSDPDNEAYSWCINESGVLAKIPERGSDCLTTAFYNFPTCIHDWADQVPHGYAITRLQTSGATAEVSGLAGLLVSLYPKALLTPA